MTGAIRIYVGITITILTCYILFQCNISETSAPIVSDGSSSEEILIRGVHNDYVQGWLEGDESKIMDLIEDNAMIQPNRIQPISGKEKIRSFWFPRDGSQTWIRNYQTEIINLQLMDTIAVTTHTSLLDWDYRKDSLAFGRIQKGINTTVYRRQSDGQWKIWRSMWTDLTSEAK